MNFVSYIKKHKEGFILTIVFHAIVLLLILKLGFFTPLPLPEEKGVLVDFGNNDNGFGKVEPVNKPTPTPVQSEELQEQVTPPIPESKPITTPTPVENVGKEEVMTQNFEQTAAIEAGKKKAEEDRLKKLEEDKKKKLIEEKKKTEELEKKRLEEIERAEIAKAEKRRKDSLQVIENARQAELKRIAEEKRLAEIKKAEEQARIDAINSRAKNVFGGSTGSNNNTNNSSGQGVTYGQGNQGTSTGTAGAERYGLGGGEGISFNLIGRSAESLNKPKYPGQEEGIVVVQITVDNSGKVTKANPGVRGSTSLNPDLLNAAKAAALATRFNEDRNAAAFQTGTITYHFVLD